MLKLTVYILLKNSRQPQFLFQHTLQAYVRFGLSTALCRICRLHKPYITPQSEHTSDRIVITEPRLMCTTVVVAIAQPTFQLQLVVF